MSHFRCVVFFLPTLFQIILLVFLVFKVYCRSNQSIAFNNDIYNQPQISLHHFPSSVHLGVNNVYEPQPRQSHASVSRMPMRRPTNLQQIPVPLPAIPNKASHYDIPAQLQNEVQNENLYDKIKNVK